MSGSKTYEILTPEDGPPADVVNARGQAPICLVCEHASAVIPPALGTLGLTEEDRLSHAVWDIGAEHLARDLSRKLDAPLVVARVSRLVCDLNRPPNADDAIPSQSGEIPVPGNRDLSDFERAARTAEVYEPFHATVSDLLDKFDTPPAFVTVHSFTPTWQGKARDTQLGLLHHADSRLATSMLAHCDTSLETRLNEPYSAKDGVTHMLERHATSRGLQSAMIEVRNDLLGQDADVARMSALLASILTSSLDLDASPE